MVDAARLARLPAGTTAAGGAPLIVAPAPRWYREAQALLDSRHRGDEALARVEVLLKQADPQSTGERAMAAGLEGLLASARKHFGAARQAFERALPDDQAAGLLSLEVDHLSGYLVAAMREGAVSYADARGLVMPRWARLRQVPRAQTQIPLYLGEFAANSQHLGDACQLLHEAEEAVQRWQQADLLGLVPPVRAWACQRLSADPGAGRWFAAAQNHPSPGSCEELLFLESYVYGAISARARDFLPGRSRPLAGDAVGPGFPPPAAVLPGATSLDGVLRAVLARSQGGGCQRGAEDLQRLALNLGWLACQEGRPAPLPLPAPATLGAQERLERLELLACQARVAGDAAAALERQEEWEREAKTQRVPLVVWRARLSQAEALSHLHQDQRAAALLAEATAPKMPVALCLGEGGDEDERRECLAGLRAQQAPWVTQVALAILLDQKKPAAAWAELRAIHQRTTLAGQIAALLQPGSAQAQRLLELARRYQAQVGDAGDRQAWRTLEQGLRGLQVLPQPAWPGGAVVTPPRVLALACARQFGELTCFARLSASAPRVLRTPLALWDLEEEVRDPAGTAHARYRPGAREALARALLEPLRDWLEQAERLQVLATRELRAVDLLGLPLPPSPWRSSGLPLHRLLAVEYSEDLGPADDAQRACQEHQAGLLVAGGPYADVYKGPPTLAPGVGTVLWGVPSSVAGAPPPASRDLLLQQTPRSAALLWFGHIQTSGLGLTSGLLTAEHDTVLTDVLALSCAPREVALIACQGGATGSVQGIEGLSLEQAYLLRGSQAVLASIRRLDPSEGRRIFDRLLELRSQRRGRVSLAEELGALRGALDKEGLDGSALRVFVR